MNRNQIVLYSQGQNIFVTCQNGSAVTLNYHRKVTGLTLISLPSHRDCSLTTRESQFRASPYSEALTFQAHNIGVKFSTAELLNLTQQELKETTRNINQFHLKDVSLDEARAAFKRVQFSDEISYRQGYVIVGLICLAIIIITLGLLYGVYKGRLLMVKRRLGFGRTSPQQVEVPLDQMGSNATSVLDGLLENN